MAIQDLTLVQVLQNKMRWHQKRQAVLAQNIANSDTPNYRARDLAKFEVDVPDKTTRSVAVARTQAGHMSIGGGTGRHGEGSMNDSDRKTFEVRPSGNAVSLEEQISKSSENAAGYQASTAMLQKVIGLYRTALRTR